MGRYTCRTHVDFWQGAPPPPPHSPFPPTFVLLPMLLINVSSAYPPLHDFHSFSELNEFPLQTYPMALVVSVGCCTVNPEVVGVNTSARADRCFKNSVRLASL